VLILFSCSFSVSDLARSSVGFTRACTPCMTLGLRLDLPKVCVHTLTYFHLLTVHTLRMYSTYQLVAKPKQMPFIVTINAQEHQLPSCRGTKSKPTWQDTTLPSDSWTGALEAWTHFNVRSASTLAISRSVEVLVSKLWAPGKQHGSHSSRESTTQP